LKNSFIFNINFIQLYPFLFFVLLILIFLATSCSINTNDEYKNKKILSREEAINNYWDEIKEYIDGTEMIEACSLESRNCYDLEADIEDGVIVRIYFPNGGYLDFLAEIDEDGYASDLDKYGNDWEFYIDMDSSIIDEAIYNWAQDNDYEIE